jgi:transcriptional regulator with XRE-family HTH domain
LSIATTKRDLLNSMRDREFRAAFNLENVYTTICFQLRALREQRGLSQGAFGRRVQMAPERISILEDPNAGTKPNLRTLLRLAEGLDVGLEARFVPFSRVLDTATDTDMEGLEVDSFEAELPLIEQGVAHLVALENQIAVGNIGADYGWQLELSTGTRNEAEPSPPWLEKARQKKEPVSEHNPVFLIKGGLADAARVGATG